jgi:hypothetical protein
MKVVTTKFSYYCDRAQSDDESTIRGDEQQQMRQSKPRPSLDHRISLYSDEGKTVWQGQYEPSSMLNQERSDSRTHPWERRETMDGLYYYLINLNTGQMTDPKPVLRDDSDGKDSYESMTKRKEIPPPRPNKHGSRSSPAEYVSRPRAATISDRDENPRVLKIYNSPAYAKLDSTSTQHSKNSKSSSEPIPPGPISYYSPSKTSNYHLRQTVLKGSSKEPSLLPRLPIGTYNNRVTYRKTAERERDYNTSPQFNINKSLENSLSSSEVDPPSPRSHCGFTPALKRQSIRSHQWSFISEEEKTSYRAPFVNTISDIEDKERREKDFERLKEWNEKKEIFDSDSTKQGRR